MRITEEATVITRHATALTKLLFCIPISFRQSTAPALSKVPAQIDSLCSELPPADEQLIDQLRGFLAITFLEPLRRGAEAFPIVAAQ